MFMLLALLLSNSPIIFKISAVSHCDKNIVLMLRGILGLAKNLVKSWFITAESLFIRVEEATLVFRFLAMQDREFQVQYITSTPFISTNNCSQVNFMA